MDIQSRLSAIVMDTVETIVVALSIFVVVYLFAAQPNEVKGSSMVPTFHDGEYILTDKISYKLRDPIRGEVIVFKAPRNPDVDYIKRIIGVPGDKIKVENQTVFVNGAPINEPYIADKTNLFGGSYIKEGEEITVPKGYLWVMGDNRPHSSDSREFGPIKESDIIGRAFFRYWPPTVLGLIKTAEYPGGK
ncbi:MAG: Signal peptidase I [Candidatus Gottesmanbacteria bacterium GW2011_GWC2_39_8]|uniref:Signal peptidase I n=1 Tax=Candidatus Gottesmanbacteria bacterium GW2011_GWC2_39_8 TaxID=1618450 RepID=A0A0G0T9A8_9BACT|nr:MAG: Signal peptidase I [Candidatus Gottesmanbacteria bacterium GW2011_GWC2_39_8]